MKWKLNVFNKDQELIKKLENCTFYTLSTSEGGERLDVSDTNGRKILYAFKLFKTSLQWKGIRIYGFDSFSEQFLEIWAIASELNNEEKD